MARPHPALMSLAAGRPLPAIDDHDQLVASSVEHRMAGLLWSRALRGELSGSGGWKLALAARDMGTQARHRTLWQTIGEVTARLDAISVEVAVIKGVPSERRWYDREGERPSADIDLLVHPDHLGRVAEIVGALDPGHPLRDNFQAIFDRGLHQSMDLEVDGIAVDLHLDLFKLGPPARHPDRLWERTCTVPHPGAGEVRVLDAQLALVHFLVHMNRDSFCRLLGYADVARILDREEIDWDDVDRILADEGLQVPVREALSAVTSTLAVPGSFPSLKGWRPYLWRRSWSPSVRLQGDLGHVRYRHRPKLLPVLVTGGLPDAGRWALGQLFPSAPLVAYSNPGRRGPRWWRLVRGRLGRLVHSRRLVAHLRRAESRPGVAAPP